MVIDKNTTLMNTFSKGMNTDTSDAYLEEGSYRLANNLRYITNQEENSGELHMIEGATLLTAIPGARVLAATLLRDTGIIITTRAGNGDWQVYTIDHLDNNRLDKIIDVKNGKHPFEQRVIGLKLSLVTRWEDDENIKLYIADGIGPIITIFLDPDRYTEIVDVEDIVAYPQSEFKCPRFAGLIDGDLKAGMYEYSYQYYIKHGQLSEISPSTKLIPLHSGALKIDDSNRVLGYEQDAKTNKGIAVDIPIINSGFFNRLIIYRICYVEVGIPPIIEIVFDEDMPVVEGEYYQFHDTGRDSLSIVTLEEYNMMTGIHIIPKTIESMTDYMFASNIRNDNPVYKYDGFKDDIQVEYKFIRADIIGDVNNDDGKITIINAGEFNTLVLVEEYDENGIYEGNNHFVNLDRFINIPEDGDKNNTYANPYVSYSLKSLRRGETYRYGIVLYDKYHNATAVKHIGDITVPLIEAFKKDLSGKLHVYPLGIRFKVTNLPKDAVAYEIVRCGKDLSNMSTIMQCVISRPIYRVYDLESADKSGRRPESTTTPLTPTGFVTNMDCYFGVCVKEWKSIYELNFDNNCHHGLATYSATNSNIQRTANSEEIKGNSRIFQAISPEYMYLLESVKDMLSKNMLTIDPILYISPQKDLKKTAVFNNTEVIQTVMGEFYGGEISYSVHNIGNEFAYVALRDIDSSIPRLSGIKNKSAISIDTFLQTLVCYYMGGNSTVDVSGRDDFYKNYKKNDSSRYAYIKLYNQDRNIPLKPLKEIEITSVGYPDSIGWDEFATPVEKWLLKYIDKVTGIGGRNFCNWVCGGMYGVGKGDELDNQDFENDALKDSGRAGGMMGPGGKCMVIAVNDDYLAKVPGDSIMGTYLCNIKQAGGGYNIDAKYSTYRSYGNYFDVKTTTADIFDGDCFIQPFEYISEHKWAHPYLSNHRDAMIVYSIPIETSINLAYTHGYEFSKHRDSSEGNITLIQVDPSNVNNAFIQDKPLYAYNSVYSANSTSRTLAAEDSNDDDYFDSEFDYRVFNSVAKSNDEYVDNWLKFLPADFLDVDTRYGEITGLRKFNNSLVFWQENAAGLLSVNERVLITDDTNMPLTLGTADVLSRYDYMNTSNGMRKDEYADALSDTTLYWWDHNKHEILGYSGGTQVVSISKAKFAQNFLNEMDAKGKLIDSPLLWHDKQFNEVGFTVSNGDYPKAGSLMFGENIGAFSSLYSVLPKAAITFKDSTLLLNEDGTVYKWNSLSDSVKGIKNEALYPYLKYIVNANSVYTKVFDNAEIAGRLYGGGNTRTFLNPNPLDTLTFVFKTPLKQKGVLDGVNIDNTEYNFRFAIPRNNGSAWGDRLRGKTMQAELMSTSNSYDFSLQCIMTKYRISWT